jgi:formate dehydrogenase subunit gamma
MTMAELVRKASKVEIINHWIMAGSCILLCVTGYGFLFKLESVYALFGGHAAMKLVHNWTGVVFSIALANTLSIHLREALTYDADDWAWIKVMGGYLSRKPIQTPPMGRLNTGQRLLYLCIVTAGMLSLASGVLIWTFPAGRPGMLVGHLLHNFTFLFLVMAVPVHAYLGTLANPGTFRIMVSGTVPIEFARKKYPKWLKEIGKM